MLPFSFKGHEEAYVNPAEDIHKTNVLLSRLSYPEYAIFCQGNDLVKLLSYISMGLTTFSILFCNCLDVTSRRIRIPNDGDYGAVRGNGLLHSNSEPVKMFLPTVLPSIRREPIPSHSFPQSSLLFKTINVEPNPSSEANVLVPSQSLCIETRRLLIQQRHIAVRSSTRRWSRCNPIRAQTLFSLGFGQYGETCIIFRYSDGKVGLEIVQYGTQNGE